MSRRLIISPGLLGTDVGGAFQAHAGASQVISGAEFQHKVQKKSQDEQNDSSKTVW